MPRDVKPKADPVSLVVENIIRGTVLHLGDGRKLAFGEKAEVEHEIAKLLRERGQAK